MLTVDSPLVPSVVVSANPGTTIAAGRSVTLTAEVTNGGTSPTYQWYVDGVPVTGATSVTYTKDNFDSTFQDSVSVVVTSSGVCPMSTHNWVYIQVSNVGVKPLPAAGAQPSILPNPSKGSFMVKGSLGTNVDEEVTVEVTDLLGQVVYQDKITAQGGKINSRITLSSGTANGMYLLSLHTQTGNMVFHIVVGQ